jgi:hypothetical protein
MERVEIIMDAYGMSLEEAMEHVDDAIILDLDEPTYFELGYACVENFYCDISELPRETLERYFDYEAFGRDLVLSGEFTIIRDKGVSLL